MNTAGIRKTTGERIFWIFNIFIMAFMCVVTIYPLVNTVALSFNDGMDANRGGIYLFPRIFSLKNYQEVFRDPTIIRGYVITVIRTVTGTLVTLVCTGILAYGLSKKQLLGRKFYLNICIFCMIFNAGLIPTYMLYRDVKLLNNFLVYLLPGAVNIWYMILMKTFFEQIPADLEESAMLDGASALRILLRIILPVSLPIIATVCIFSAVYQWNAWYDAYMFITKRMDLHPVQTYLYRVVALSQKQMDTPGDVALLDRIRISVITLRAATVVITTIPILFIYAIFQKQFIKGVMIGALKG
ncbi:MAG: carbohydrate ABC transporter permease [Treponema sp.]|jgi:putative aldouronate transport system permease protein|nr:carbohydrate ABC transporter permease [Treponema sp.]